MSNKCDTHEGAGWRFVPDPLHPPQWTANALVYWYRHHFNWRYNRLKLGGAREGAGMTMAEWFVAAHAAARKEVRTWLAQLYDPFVVPDGWAELITQMVGAQQRLQEEPRPPDFAAPAEGMAAYGRDRLLLPLLNELRDAYIERLPARDRPDPCACVEAVDEFDTYPHRKGPGW